jgi:hypothetical protein
MRWSICRHTAGEGLPHLIAQTGIDEEALFSPWLRTGSDVSQKICKDSGKQLSGHTFCVQTPEVFSFDCSVLKIQDDHQGILEREAED